MKDKRTAEEERERWREEVASWSELNRIASFLPLIKIGTSASCQLVFKIEIFQGIWRISLSLFLSRTLSLSILLSLMSGIGRGCYMSLGWTSCWNFKSALSYTAHGGPGGHQTRNRIWGAKEKLSRNLTVSKFEKFKWLLSHRDRQR